jgi:hypothetical protein
MSVGERQIALQPLCRAYDGLVRRRLVSVVIDPVASLGLPVPAFRPISGDLAVVVDKPGGDREAQAKGIRYAHGIHETHYQESVLIRSAAEAKIREADRLECEAWNAIMWTGGPAMPSPCSDAEIFSGLSQASVPQSDSKKSQARRA